MTLDTLRTAFYAVLAAKHNECSSRDERDRAIGELCAEILRQGQGRETFEKSWEAKA